MLIKNWDTARKTLLENSIASWVKTGLGNASLATRLEFLAKLGATQTDAALTATLTLLDPGAPLYWRGRIVSQNEFIAKGEPQDFPDSEMAISLLASGFGEWISDDPSAHWINRIVKCCRERATVIGLPELGMATPLHWWCLLADSDSLQNTARKVRALYVTSRNEKIAALFSKPVLSDLEALALATASEDDFLMPGKAWEELLTLLLPTLEDLKLQASLRPCSHSDLQAVERDLAGVLEKIRSQREQFRLRQTVVPEPPHFLNAIESVRVAVQQSINAHRQAQAGVDRLKNLIHRGHVKMAVAQMATVQLEISNFSDLNLDFVHQAAVQYRLRRRKLMTLGGIATVGFILILISIKILTK